MIVSFILSSGLLADSPRPGRILVKVKEGKRIPKFNLMKSGKKLFKNYYVLYSNDIVSLAKKLKQHPSVEQLKVDSKRKKISKLPQAKNITKDLGGRENSEILNDPGVKRQWHLKGREDNGMDILKAYEELGRKQGKEIIVAVVDTGVDYNHEDLKSIMWVNENEIPNNGIDDDNNGYIDDVHGIDTLDRNAKGKATGDPMDTHNHGTHVSGIIAAAQNNGIGVAGVASNVKIMAIRTVPNFGDETDIDVAESFLYAAKMGARVINCSFGKAKNEGGMLVRDTINHIGQKYGVLVVASAGNESSNIDTKFKYPASFDSPNLLTVASSTSRGRLSGFSNYGKKNVDLTAPGSGIYSTVRRNRYASMSGTSMSGPAAAGVVAETLSRNPKLNPIALKKLIMKSVEVSEVYKGKMVAPGLSNLKNSLENL